jgi:rod shape-determining protein MreD
MRLLPTFILAYVALGLQIGLGDFVSYQGARPNLVLLAVVFIALNAPRDAALLAAFSLGLVQDLLSQQAPGLYALSYSLAAMVIVNVQNALDREHPLTHVSVALASGLLTAVMLTLQGWLRPPGARVVVDSVTLPAIRVSAGTFFLSALYTAVLAPLALWGLQRSRRVFGFQAVRGRY